MRQLHDWTSRRAEKIAARSLAFHERFRSKTDCGREANFPRTLSFPGQRCLNSRALDTNAAQNTLHLLRFSGGNERAAFPTPWRRLGRWFRVLRGIGLAGLLEGRRALLPAIPSRSSALF